MASAAPQANGVTSAGVLTPANSLTPRSMKSTRSALGSSTSAFSFVWVLASASLPRPAALSRALSSSKPPFPAVVGVFGGPTVVNNVETIQAVPWIVEHGAAEYRKFGTEKSPGTKLFCVSGPVNRPGLYEIPLGMPLKTLVYDLCGGMKNGKRMKANIPGGSSVPVLTGEEAEKVNIDYEAMAAAGTMLGSGGMIVIDEDTCMVWSLAILLKFYAHESCGQCTPCREGTGWLRNIVYRLESGGGTKDDLDKLLSICRNMMGTTICVLSDAAAMPTESFIRKFRGEFEAHVGAGRCPIRGKSSYFLTAHH